MQTIEKTTRILSGILLLNNLSGIALNPFLTLASCFFFGIGVPGIGFCFVLMSWTFKKIVRPHRHYFTWCGLMFIYNAIILYLCLTLGDSLLEDGFYPAIFPIINMLIFSIIIVLHQTLSPSEKTN